MRRGRKTVNELTRRLAMPSEFPIMFAYVPVSFVDADNYPERDQKVIREFMTKANGEGK